nr:hypothetical protein Iba_chr11bCG12010 [Ipomoea batatas]
MRGGVGQGTLPFRCIWVWSQQLSPAVFVGRGEGKKREERSSREEGKGKSGGREQDRARGERECREQGASAEQSGEGGSRGAQRQAQQSYNMEWGENAGGGGGQRGSVGGRREMKREGCGVGGGGGEGKVGKRGTKRERGACEKEIVRVRKQGSRAGGNVGERREATASQGRRTKPRGVGSLDCQGRGKRGACRGAVGTEAECG